MATTEGDVQVSLKLLVNKETNKVLFGEAGKDFVDVLFSFLTFPLGTIARLLEKDSYAGAVTIGCLNSLYHCVAGLDNCLQTHTFKEILLKPRNSSEDYCNTIKLNIDDTHPTKFFTCNNRSCCFLFGCSTTQANCSCGKPLKTVFLKHSCNGFVNDAATFIITDDLIVMPNSVDYIGFALLQSLGIKNPSSVTEMTLNFTKEKVPNVLDLLKHCLLSKSSLTDIFLEKKPIIERSRFFSCSVEDDSSIKIKLKLGISRSDGKILYAQGEKDFADMLLSFLTFPLGGVVRKLGGNCSLGSIDGLYGSIAVLNENVYFTSKAAKNRLVDPHLLPLFKLSMPISSIYQPSVFLEYYCYYPFFNYEEGFIHLQLSKEQKCQTSLNFIKMRLCDVRGSFEGIVRGPAMYLATDDLAVEPCSPISIINLINRLNIPFNDIKEKVVTIGMRECLSILKASLTSTSALTSGLGHLLTEDKE